MAKYSQLGIRGTKFQLYKTVSDPSSDRYQCLTKLLFLSELRLTQSAVNHFAIFSLRLAWALGLPELNL